jgi:hypothetical protein
MGGLKLINSDVMANGLLLNYLDRYLGGKVTGIMNQRLEVFQQLNGTRGLKEMLEIYGPKIWEQFSVRMQWYSFFWASVFQAVSDMLAKNESSEGWGVASIAGHGKCEQFVSRAEQVTLEEEGIRRVEDLFGKNEFTGRLDKRIDREYSDAFKEGHQELWQKCKEMRKFFWHQNKKIETPVGMPFIRIVQNIKKSRLIRDMHRQGVDEKLGKPSTYSSRENEGYALPGVGQYMKGYTNIMKAKVSERTREVSFLIMNRQIWTREKYAMYTARGGVDTDNGCGLCGERENTFHLIWECDAYAQKMWKQVQEIIGEVEGRTTMVTAYHVMYSVYMSVQKCNPKEIMVLLMEVKRDILHRHFKRGENDRLNRIRYDRDRILCHLLNTVKRIISLRKFAAQNWDLFQQIETSIQDKIIG